MSSKEFLSRILKSIHIILASGIIGGLAAILVLLGVKAAVDAAADATIDHGILVVFRWLITYPSFAFIVTSCLYSLFFSWGIVRFGWVALKWLLLLGLFALVWFGLGPAVSGLASVSDAGFHVSSMAERIISAVVLSVVILGVAGLTVSEQSLEKYRRMPIKEISAAGIPDGAYAGESTVGNLTYRVKVEVDAGMIVGISEIGGRHSVYVEYAQGVFGKIIREQTANTDAITGATTTSKAYMKAVEDALHKAGAR
jgi:uncharacterized protein with FMN-binding domain